MKKRKSILDAHADLLREWELAGRTLVDMQAQLKTVGCVISLGRLSAWLTAERQRCLRERLFAQIATGGRMNRELDAAFQANPAPEIHRLIEITKTLIMSLQVEGAANADLLQLANSMQQTVLSYLAGETRAQLESRKLELAERRLTLLEKKAAAYDRAQAALKEAGESKGGISPETLRKIETELRLL